MFEAGRSATGDSNKEFNYGLTQTYAFAFELSFEDHFPDHLHFIQDWFVFLR